MSTNKAKRKAGKRQASAKSGRRRRSLKDLVPSKGGTQAVMGGLYILVGDNGGKM